MISSIIKEEKHGKNWELSDKMSQDKIQDVIDFHRKFNEYTITPLHSLDSLASELKVGKIFVKDESFRFNLNAFKVLGGAFAMGMYLSNRLNIPINQLSFDLLKSQKINHELGDLTFVTATDGNHGRGVAWAAKQLNKKCVVYMPKGSSNSRLENIRNEGAEASIIEGNYDDAVRLADTMAKENGWVVVQDTAWEGYEEIPNWIMQGYGTIIHEVMDQIDEAISHVFLQAGVGSFAGAIIGYLANRLEDKIPKCYIVEPDKADCLFRSAKNGQITNVTGSMDTIMAGLACGEVNSISWNIIDEFSSGYFSCKDEISARGMRILASPKGSDKKVISGESGAVGIGLLSVIKEEDRYKEIREKMGLDEKSVILVISTEGDTDPKRYKEIVWDGHFSYRSGENGSY